jgi:hypothetical protein
MGSRFHRKRASSLQQWVAATLKSDGVCAAFAVLQQKHSMGARMHVLLHVLRLARRAH